MCTMFFPFMILSLTENKTKIKYVIQMFHYRCSHRSLQKKRRIRYLWSMVLRALTPVILFLNSKEKRRKKKHFSQFNKLKNDNRTTIFCLKSIVVRLCKVYKIQLNRSCVCFFLECAASQERQKRLNG